MQNVEVEITRPPILIGTLVGGRRGHSAVHDGALCIAVVVVHGMRSRWLFITLSFTIFDTNVHACLVVTSPHE